MDKSWVKLFRRINTHPISKDMVALGVFTWLLTNVNYQTGKIFIGRFATSKQLGLKPTTFRDVVKRLEKKYAILTTAITPGVGTEISLTNWAKYQAYLKTDATYPATGTPLLKNKNILNKHNTNSIPNSVNKNSTNSYKEKIYKEFEEAGLPSPRGFSSMVDYLKTLNPKQAWVFAEKFAGRSL